MSIFLCLVFAALVLVTSLFSLYYVWKKKELKSFFVQFVVIIFSIAGGIYAIIQYPSMYSIAKALNFLSPLK